ncbi:VWFA domain-containing protein [Aphelenchoides besseyi]|nr:VWFA domain-containing protein [Aphelenchoides besseyi]KAI6212008.1 VWFA domain-containing protein [Aphelenchoides besseyi]
MDAGEELVYLHLTCSQLPSHLRGSAIQISVHALKSDGQSIEIGDTEVLYNDSTDLLFQRSIQIVVRFDLHQQLRFDLHMMTNENIPNVIGSVSAGLRSVVNAPSEILLPLEPSGDPLHWDLDESPLLGVEAVPPESSKNGTILQFHAHNLHADGIANLAPYFTVSLMHNSIKKFPTLLYRSEVPTADTNSPIWKEFIIPTKFLSLSSQTLIEIACYSFRNNHTEDIFLGKFPVTFMQLLNGTITKFMLHVSGRKKRENTYFELIKFDRIPSVPTFVSAVRSGMKLHFTIAVDFATNNGSPHDPDSLHYMHPNIYSHYYKALADIASCVCPYDAQRRVSLVGFGAKVPPQWEFSQYFPLNGVDKNNPYVRGVPEILSAYRRAAMSVHPFAPTNYADTIHKIIKMAKTAVEKRTDMYFVLIILTNGYLQRAPEVADTVDQIVEASELPISICFAGIQNEKHKVGKGDHSRLTRLVDPTMKSSKNRPLTRQCVSYVDYEEEQDKSSVRELLSLIPMQVSQYLLSSFH